MNDLTKSTERKPAIPAEMQSRWQRIVNLMARLADVPAAVIQRIDPPRIEVFLSSDTEGNPFHPGARSDLHPGLFCQKVMKEQVPLLVRDSLKDPEWNQNSGISSDFTFYLGYPLTWPDGEPFGTICLLDRKENQRAIDFRGLLSEFMEVVEGDLRLLIEAHRREDLLGQVEDHRDRLRETVAEQTSELEKRNEMLEELVGFQTLAADLSAVFVSLPPDRVHEEIQLALDRICRFFKADHCALLEVLADRGRAYFLNLNLQEDRQRELPHLDIASINPWAYRRLVEHGEPVIFSSLEALPPEAGVDRAAWEQEKIQAMLMLPLRFGMQVTHLIGLMSHSIGHEWPMAHIPGLRLLGETFAKALDHKGTQETLLTSERALNDAQRIAHLGSWVWEISGGIHRWSDEFYRIFGLLPEKVAATYEAFLACVHPDDRQAVDRANQEAISDPCRPLSGEYRVVRGDGTERVVHARADVFFDQGRRPVRMVGTVQDITEYKHSEEKLKKALDEIRMLKDRLEAENVYLRDEVTSAEGLGEIIGLSSAMKYVIHRIKQVARTEATVLLLGETGTGKGVFAHALHEASDRRGKLFVHVNCAGLPPNLIESELFGREKGAFTGSTARQIGRFELAGGGTIFLDEIGELPIELQSKLLKVLEDGEFERLGSPYPVKVDVRIIASTNRDLMRETKQGRFRMDLLYRINVFPVTIPPLRQRKEDIPLFVEFYAKKFSQRYRKDIRRVPKTTMKALENYDWPGNVRELINVIERAVIVSEGSTLRLSEKIDALQNGFFIQKKAFGAAESPEAKEIGQVERDHILSTLLQTGWKIEGAKGAAQILGLNPNTLRSRMKKFGIKRPGAS